MVTRGANGANGAYTAGCGSQAGCLHFAGLTPLHLTLTDPRWGARRNNQRDGVFVLHTSSRDPQEIDCAYTKNYSLVRVCKEIIVVEGVPQPCY